MANNLDGNQISLSELVILNNNQDASVLNKLSLLKDYNVRPISGAGATITLPDLGRIKLGTGSDLILIHDGSQSYIAADDLNFIPDKHEKEWF